VRFGLFTLLPRRDVSRSPGAVLEETLALADVAEATPAFDSIWIAEHHFSNYGLVASPLPFAVKLAERTRRLRLATAVLVLPFYHPLRLAEEIALVDHLTGGRLTVGLGRGYQPYEFARFGLTLEQSRGLFDEGLEVLVRALSQPSFSFEGAHFRIPAASLALPPLQRPHPPMVIAASSPESLGQAARRGFAVVTTANWFPMEQILPVRRAYEEQLGRAGRGTHEADFSCMRFVYVTDSKADMLEAAEQGLWICRVSGGFRDNRARVRDGQVEMDQPPDEPSPELFAERMIFGDAETCIEKLERLRETLRPTRLLYNAQLGGLPPDRVRRSLERFAERVAPHFARAAVGATQAS